MCVCISACTCAMGLFDVVVLVHFKGKAVMRILQNSRAKGGEVYSQGVGFKC